MTFLLNPFIYGGGGGGGYTLAAGTGALALTGGGATLKRGLRMIAAPGALSLTGGAATLTYVSGYSMTAGTGALVLTGGAAALKRSLRMVAAPGALALTGGAATLTYNTGGIEFVGRASTATGADAADQVISLTSLTGGSRSSVADGDIVIAAYQASVNSDLTLVIEDPSASAYTLIGSEAYVNNGSDTNLRVAYKIMGSTPDASVTFKTTSGTSNNSRIHTVYVFSGVDTTTPMDVTPTSSSAGNTVLVNPAAITPVTSGATVVAVGAGGHQRGTHTFSSSDLSDFYSEGHNTLFDATSGIGHIPNWTSGAVDPAAWTFSSTTLNTYTYASITFALRPA